MEKSCSACKRVKPWSGFYLYQGKPSSRCRECRLAYERKRYAEMGDVLKERKRIAYRANPDKARAIVRAQYAKHIERNRQMDRDRRAARYEALDRTKANARQFVVRALRDGRLAKPTHCTQCAAGPLFGRALHAHHEDYSQPLAVRWLCVSCHGREHREVA